MNSQLRRVLLAENPWLRGEDLLGWIRRFLPASYIPRRLRLTADHRVVLVVGPRQVGKSTLIWKTLAEAAEPVLYVNCEEPSMREWLSSPAEFLADVAEYAGQARALFLEEVQRLPEAGLFLKGLVDRRPGLRIYATGSSSFDLEAATRESLAGRAQRHLLLPVSLAEAGSVLPGNPLAQEEGLSRLVERMMIFGGYPTVFTSDDPRQELASLVEAFVVRDASDRFRIRNTAALQKILELAASQIGNLVNLSEWAALSNVSNDTVADYCRLLEETHLIRLVRPFVGGKRAEITSARKVFLLDNGIRNQLFGGFQPAVDRPDRGALLENLVFTELAKTVHPLLDRLSTWRSKSGAEMDFVVEHQGRLLACEVKAGGNRGGLSRSARSFLDAYQPEQLLVVNRRDTPEVEIGSTRVRCLRAEELAGTVEAFLAVDRVPPFLTLGA
ncbi:MAG TPA: ATP-binding protein [Thermoanaerobaculia bacterium]|nr:ATP-binding protein [Thermoanaerobaculia bacterium]